MKCRIETCNENVHVLISCHEYKFGFCPEHWIMNESLYQHHKNKGRVNPFKFVGDKHIVVTDYYDDVLPFGCDVVIREFDIDGLWVAKNMNPNTQKVYIPYNFIYSRLGGLEL